MDAAYLVVTLLTAAANAWAAANDVTRPAWLLDNMGRLGVPVGSLGPLGALKAAGALGLVVGIAVPPVGVAAAAGLVVFFAGAVATVVRARWYAHLWPVFFLALAVASLALRLATW